MKANPLWLVVVLLPACQSAGDTPPSLASRVQAVEAASGGRLGVALADDKGRLINGNRAGERFAFCSTFKLILAGIVLDGHRRGSWSLDDRLPVTKADLVFHSPFSETRVAPGWLSMRDAARAVVTVSDNAAANILIRKVGGIDAFNQWLRVRGDMVTRIDRLEPKLNENRAGDPRDTTTPEQIARTAANLAYGDWLQAKERRLLREWLVASETGRERIRAGLPQGWLAGDKTGTCGGEGRESYNDVAFIEPGDGRGYILAVYLDRPKGDPASANAHAADVARAAVAMIGEK